MTHAGPRSYLMTPTLNVGMLKRATDRGADAVVLDLEDSVGENRRSEARRNVANALDESSHTYFVRINSPAVSNGELATEDLKVLDHPCVTGIVVPKVEHSSEVSFVERWLQSTSQARDDLSLIPLIETPAGVERLHEILETAASNVDRVAFGAGDYTAELGTDWSHEPEQLLYPRSRIAAVSSTFGLGPPIDTGSPLLEDYERFTADAKSARSLGFRSKFCIHPRQVEWIHELFEPTEDEINEAMRVVEAYRSATRREGELVTSVDGRMVDLPIVKSSLAVLRRAGRDI